MSIFDAILELFGELSTNVLLGGGSSKKRIQHFKYRPPGDGPIYISIVKPKGREIIISEKVGRGLTKGLARKLSNAGYIVMQLNTEDDFIPEKNSYFLRIAKIPCRKEHAGYTDKEALYEVIRYELLNENICEIIKEVQWDSSNKNERAINQEIVVSLNKKLYEILGHVES